MGTPPLYLPVLLFEYGFQFHGNFSIKPRTYLQTVKPSNFDRSGESWNRNVKRTYKLKAYDLLQLENEKYRSGDGARINTAL